MRRSILLLLSIALLGLTPAWAQRLIPTSSFTFNVDYARFHYSKDECYLEVYYAFHPRLLSFEGRQGSLAGAVVLHTRLTNEETGAVEVSREVLIPLTMKDTSAQSLGTTFVTHTGFAIPHGKYTLEVAARDTMAPARRDTLRYSLRLDGYKNPMALSDLELCSSIRNSTDTAAFFYKNTLEIVPNPTQVFGIMNHPVMFYYLELYNVVKDQPWKLHARLIESDGKVVRESHNEKRFKHETAVEVGMMNLSSVRSGKYLLRVTVVDQAGKEVAGTEKNLYVYNPHVKSPEMTAADMIAGDLSGLTEEELDAEFEKAQYVATGSDMTFYSRLVTVDAKRHFLADFWAKVESGKPGKISIARREYLDRVAACSERFRAFKRPGWKTDRGRIYVLYAEPDQIDRVPSSEGGKPHETWHYYDIENGVVFVFVDRTGFGEYVLVHSTKRGELQDENWRRLLQ